LSKEYLPRIRARIIADIVRDRRDGFVADVGCGDGTVSIPLLANGHRLLMIDPSAEMLSRAKASVPLCFRSRVAFMQSGLETLPAMQFSVVVAVGLLAHVASVADALASLRELLTPDGILIVQITDCSTAIGRLNFGYMSWRERRKSTYGYALNRLSAKNLEELAEAADLSVVSCTRYSVIVPGVERLPDSIVYGLSVLSTVAPLRWIGGESMFVLRRS
jgi:SAM-dependent methyltransferase